MANRNQNANDLAQQIRQNARACVQNVVERILNRHGFNVGMAATAKDDYPLHVAVADMLVDSALGNEILSSMNWYCGYNQIYIEGVHR